MPQGGVTNFDHDVARDGFYLAGRMFYEMIPEGISREPSQGATVIPTHAGTHKVHVPYIGLARPEMRRAYRFNFSWVVNDQDDYYKLLEAANSSDIFDFCPFLWVVDRFSGVDSGEVYRTSRRFARSVISGITDITHPDEYAVDGVVTPGWPSGTSDQEFTAGGDANVVVVRYLPVHHAVVGQLSEVYEVNNKLVVDVELVEVLRD